MGGGGKQSVEPKEEINLDTTNFGLWNISDNGYSTFGVGEVLTAIVLVLILAIIAKYCCKRAAVARRSELEETIDRLCNCRLLQWFNHKQSRWSHLRLLGTVKFNFQIRPDLFQATGRHVNRVWAIQEGKLGKEESDDGFLRKW